MGKLSYCRPQYYYTCYARRVVLIAVGALMLSLLLLPTTISLAAMPPTGALGQRPTVFALPPRFNAPTPNLNLVANALGLKTKSLSILLTAQPGLAVTNPVNIRVTYNSSATGSRWIQNIYDAKNGYRNFHNDPDGNRAKRHMKLDILLTEQQPGNQFVNFPITWEFDLDPLFDVSLTPLRFTLNTSCERFYEGDADIHFLWYSPDAPKYSERSFQSSKGKTTVINEFAWARQEMSAAANLLFPTFSFYEKDTNIFSPLQYDIPKPSYKLLPGSSGYVGRTLNDSSGQKGCSADVSFTITISVRQYLNL